MLQISSTLKKILFSTALLLSVASLKAQNVGINATGTTPNQSAGLDIDFSDKGLLIPRIALTSTTDVMTIASPATSSLVYNTNTAITSGSGAGYYYFDGTKWVRLFDSNLPIRAWELLGNANTNPTTNFLGTTDNQPLVFRTNNTEKVRILANGNVGIGTNAPVFKLEVSGDVAVVNKTAENRLLISEINETASGFGLLTSIVTGTQRGVLIKDRQSLQGGLWLLGGDDNANNSRGAIGMGWVGDISTMKTSSSTPSAIVFHDGSIRFMTDNAKVVGTTYNNFATSDRMRITPTGDVGIGTTNPVFKLDVKGDVAIINKTAENRFIVSEINETLSNTGLLTSIVTGQQRGILIKDLPTRQGGLWLIGGDNTPNNSRGAIGTGWVGDFGTMRTSTTTPSAITFDDGSIRFMTDNARVIGTTYFDFANSEKMRITPTGELGIGTTTPIYQLQVVGNIGALGFINTSDKRLKNNVLPSKYGLREIMQLKPVTFEWNKDNDGTRVGFIAQEVRKVIPEIVSEGKDKDKTLGIYYNEFSPIFTKAIQEQQAMIEELKAQNEVLKLANAKLQNEQKQTNSAFEQLNSRLQKIENSLKETKASNK